MATKFTEGSWRVEWGTGPDSEPYFDILKNDGDAGDDGRMVDASYSIVEAAFPVIENEEEYRANANLIGAAPDLYAALDGLRTAIRDIKAGADIGWWPQLDRAMGSAEMALAYARGENYRPDVD